MAAAVAALTIEDERELIDCGVDPWVFTRLRSCTESAEGGYRFGLVGYRHISLEPSGKLYYPDPLGQPAFLTPIRRQRFDTIAADLPAYIWFGELIDIIAWSPCTPDKWARRVGDPDARWLGLMPYPCPYPLPIHSTPIAWLGGACRGICPLTEDVSLILAVDSALPESHAHRASLIRRLGMDWDDPRMLTPVL